MYGCAHAGVGVGFGFGFDFVFVFEEEEEEEEVVVVVFVAALELPPPPLPPLPLALLDPRPRASAHRAAMSKGLPPLRLFQNASRSSSNLVGLLLLDLGLCGRGCALADESPGVVVDCEGCDDMAGTVDVGMWQQQLRNPEPFSSQMNKARHRVCPNECLGVWCQVTQFSFCIPLKELFSILFFFSAFCSEISAGNSNAFLKLSLFFARQC